MIADRRNSRQPRESQSAGPPVAFDGRFQRTDLGLAQRFAKQHGDRVRFCHAWGKWLCWGGVRWKIDDTGEAMRRAKQTAQRLFDEVAKASDNDVQNAVAFALASQGRCRLEATLELAKSEQPIPVTVDQLDADGWQLNTESGTIDLRTGILRPNDPGDLFTKTTGTEYFDGPGWDCPIWTGFLDEIFAGDSELIRFVKRLCGVALVGEQREHLLPILWGHGANGKSVFTGALQHVLGDYAGNCAPGLLMSDGRSEHPTQLADLFGKRLVILSETADGGRLNEALVKSLTGGDRIKARRMREDYWEFNPTHLPVMVTNHRPQVVGTDNGIWRRLLLIPFEVTIPPEKQDKSLPEKLRAEAPGILRWCVEGCLEWQREGLSPPERVRLATDQYRGECDSIGSWLTATARLVKDGSTPNTTAYASYQRFCEAEGYQALTQTTFSIELSNRGFTKVRKTKGRHWVGFIL